MEKTGNNVKFAISSFVSGPDRNKRNFFEGVMFGIAKVKFSLLVVTADTREALSDGSSAIMMSFFQ